MFKQSFTYDFDLQICFKKQNKFNSIESKIQNKIKVICFTKEQLLSFHMRYKHYSLNNTKKLFNT